MTGRTLTPVETLYRGSRWRSGPRALVALAVRRCAAGDLAAVVGARPALVVWGSYLALLVPVVGLLPSGLQVTASRYAYGPAMVLVDRARRRPGRGAPGSGSGWDWRRRNVASRSTPASASAPRPRCGAIR